jgi:hypothetical protein
MRPAETVVRNATRVQTRHPLISLQRTAGNRAVNRWLLSLHVQPKPPRRIRLGFAVAIAQVALLAALAVMLFPDVPLKLVALTVVVALAGLWVYRPHGWNGNAPTERASSALQPSNLRTSSGSVAPPGSARSSS